MGFGLLPQQGLAGLDYKSPESKMKVELRSGVEDVVSGDLFCIFSRDGQPGAVPQETEKRLWATVSHTHRAETGALVAWWRVGGRQEWGPGNACALLFGFPW